MSLVDVCDLENDFASYMKRVEEGETFIVTRNKKPLMELRLLGLPQSPLHPIGLCKGEFVVPDDFDDPLPEDIQRAFEGETNTFWPVPRNE